MVGCIGARGAHDLTTREQWQVKRLLASVRVDVLAPLKVTGRPYEVGLGVTRIGRSSFSYAYGVYDGDECVATGASTSVHVDEKGSATFVLVLDSQSS